MKWNDITELEQLTLCTWCNESIESTLFVSKTNRKKLTCNHCNCEMYQVSDRLWFKVPDKESVKQIELSSYL